MAVVMFDTDVLSIFLKEKADSRAQLYLPHLINNTVALSFITVGELYAWSALRKWGSKRRALLEQTLSYATILLSFDMELCRLFGRTKAALMEKGQVVATNDLWIAVTAIHDSLPLVTHNARDFRPLEEHGLQIITEKA
jgi:tRNA(fMet)-specific endonuclease VapC